MLRSLLWLVAGLALFAIVVVLSAPELVRRDLAGTGQVVLFAGLAGIPGVVVLVTVAVRRRGQPDPEPDASPTADRDTAPHVVDRDRADEEH